MMHRSWRPVIAGFLCLLLGVAALAADTPARVNGDRVNVRSRPGFSGEVLLRLRKDQQVGVQGLVVLSKPAANEPARWSRIALPEGTPVWVLSELVDADSKLVVADVANARSGPSPDHGAVGRLPKGTRVKTLGGITNGWIEVASTPPCSGYVPESYLTSDFAESPVYAADPAVAPVPTAPSPAPSEARPPANVPSVPPPVSATTRAVPAATLTQVPLPSAPSSPKPVAAEPAPEPAPVVPAAVAPTETDARKVRREGIVIRPTNIQAPSGYALQSRDSRRTINFLLSTRDEPIHWKEYRGKVVVVTGREYLDQRAFWKSIPLLDVETIEAVR